MKLVVIAGESALNSAFVVWWGFEEYMRKVTVLSQTNLRFAWV